MRHWDIIENLISACNNCSKKDCAGFETKFNDTKSNGKILRLCYDCFKELRAKTERGWNKFRSEQSPYLGTSDMLI